MAAATIVATVGLGYGQAHAAPDCTASGLSSALGQVASSTGAWLSAHPEAEAAVNTADENAMRRTRQEPDDRINVGVALAGVGSFLAAVVAGVFIVVGGRGNESRVSQRARRFLTWLRDEF